MKTTSHSLFNLIKRLTPTEKKNYLSFTAKISNGNASNFTILFNAINNQKVFDDNQLQTKLNLTGNQYSVTKTQLYDQILQSLLYYDPQEKSTAIIRNMISKADILYNKNLIEDSLKMITKAKELAKKYEYFVLQLEALDKEYFFLLWTSPTDVEIVIGNVQKERKEIILKYENFCEYKNLSDQTYFLYYKYGPLKEENEKVYHKIYKHPLMQDESKILTAKSHWFYHGVWGWYYTFLLPGKDPAKAFYHEKNALFGFPKNFRNEYSEVYIGLLNNYLSACTYYGYWDDFKKSLAVFEEFSQNKSLNKWQKVLCQINLQAQKLTYALQYNEINLKEKLAIGTETGEFVQCYKEDIPLQRRTLFYFYLFKLYFFSYDYKTSLKWLNLIINNSEVNVKLDIERISKLLNLVVHYELNNIEYVENQYRSTLRYLKKQGELTEIEKAVLKLIRKLLNANSSIEKKDLIIDFKNTIINIKNPELNSIETFDFLKWANDKIAYSSNTNLEIIR